MNTQHKNILLHVVIAAVLLAWAAIFVIRPTDTSAGDLGRHLQNGAIIAEAFAHGEWPAQILHTNFYSYTNSEYLFVNHHWASGLLFYMFFNTFGLIGFQIFSYCIIFLTIAMAYALAIKKSSLYIAAPVTFFMIPLLASRHDLRPEMFSYLFLVILLFLLDKYRETHRRALLFPIPIMFALWINLHIYFIFGFFVLAVFWFQENSKEAAAVCIGSAVAGLVNPFGLRLLLYPFAILHGYGIDVKEVAPIITALPGMRHGEALTFFISQIALAVLFATQYKTYLKKDLFTLIISVVFSALVWIMVRNIVMYALVILPVLCFLLGRQLRGAGHGARAANSAHNRTETKTARTVATILVCGALIITWPRIVPAVRATFVGEFPSTSRQAAEFILDNNIPGPLINDFNSGGYAAWYLFPKFKLFVDNRPEAYPADFLENTYSAMLTDQDVWSRVEKTYNPNVILLRFAEAGPKTLIFAAQRAEDDGWIPVFVNNEHLIFVKRDEQNADVIEKFEIPKTAFRLKT